MSRILLVYLLTKQYPHISPRPGIIGKKAPESANKKEKKKKKHKKN